MEQFGDPSRGTEVLRDIGERSTQFMTGPVSFHCRQGTCRVCKVGRYVAGQIWARPHWRNGIKQYYRMRRSNLPQAKLVSDGIEISGPNKAHWFRHPYL
ncbi:hypothetical protein GCM10010339_87020 [Streptomyces alanosinicus]|uniref:Uncharacterized protein n=1 Tax=Streptomyces alanosinicus TaxID=68171 RepID=A0A918YSR7_9ACTN|nr:hypothetical protein GCM10010339_87020 [Streptomyces alanosinicus]